jgi:hypothetical protein
MSSPSQLDRGRNVLSAWGRNNTLGQGKAWISSKSGFSRKCVHANVELSILKEKGTRQVSPSLDEEVGVRQPERMTSIVSVAGVDHVCRRHTLSCPVRGIHRQMCARFKRAERDSTQESVCSHCTGRYEQSHQRSSPKTECGRLAEGERVACALRDALQAVGTLGRGEFVLPTNVRQT